MPARETEAIILRTYPLKEADKIVSFFSRTYGKLRGVARGARRTKNPYGAALEPLSYVRIGYFERETSGLLTLDRSELIQSFFDAQKDYPVGVALGYLAEVTDQLLPEREPNDAFFRLLLLVLEEIRRTGQVWAALTYFDLWAVRLAGLLPRMDQCGACGRSLGAGEPAYGTAQGEALQCGDCRRVSSGATAVSGESRALALEMLSKSLPALLQRPWAKRTAQDLRRFLEQRIESHAERRLVTRKMIESLAD